MRRSLTFPIILISILLFAEIASYLAIRNFFLESKTNLKTYNWIWFGFTGLLYIIVFSSRGLESNFSKNVLVNIFMFVLLLKLFLALVFTISSLIQFIQSIFLSTKLSPENQLGRRLFSSKLAFGLSSLPFSAMIWGIVKTAYDFKIHKVKIHSPKIPNSFKGFKIVQISDIHTGSLQQVYQLEKAVNIINSLEADLIFFTGDLVNNQSDEALPYLDTLKKLKAPYGVYSILGNHDYGDYNSWKTQEEKQNNMDLMYQIHKDLGWKLLLNESVQLEKNNQTISLIGIENWGANLNFKKYGDLKKAYHNIDQNQFQILLSHDPSHWSNQVQQDYPNIDLTLSGHTHGFQFGVEIPGFKWSPSQYIYPQWAGLYKKNQQYLYVNRGLGCIGYMGRIGIKPEISLIELT